MELGSGVEVANCLLEIGDGKAHLAELLENLRETIGKFLDNKTPAGKQFYSAEPAAKALAEDRLPKPKRCWLSMRAQMCWTSCRARCLNH